MLREIEREYQEKTRSLTPAIHHYHPDASPEEMERYLKELTADMEYHLKNEKLCRFLLSSAGDIWFYEKMKESLISTGRKNFENGKMTTGTTWTIESTFSLPVLLIRSIPGFKRRTARRSKWQSSFLKCWCS